MSLPESDQVWNRAAMERGGPNPGPGDAALAAALAFHNAVMSGGVLDALERLSSDSLMAAADGFRYLALDGVADFLAEATKQRSRTGQSVGAQGALETELDLRYGALVPTDGTITERFEAAYAAKPSDFAAL